ncbi:MULTISPECIES: DNA glycosylase AlkZ-like family protein [unclassified Streptomyces]|uniref:DNA glycosylase AlkZ-like family protein n=1 Tax=unclassified Streptomyces TaxID=2593676 RepID=UPI002F915336|nr:winged helix DNA-binding domain-containing protein [Streptomyces sp. NBC_00826]WTB60706.1 winged helix DNA-binding domain-containing protein [Streptomyces sp. NBC_00826]
MTAPTPEAELSLTQTRNIAIAATLPADGFPDVTAALAHLHAVQLDSITTLARAHQLTLTARVPGTTTQTIDNALNNAPHPPAFDYPAHAQALVPLADWPLWAFRRRATHRHPHYPDEQTRTTLLDRIERDGPLPLRRLRASTEAGTGWGWSPTKTSVELLVWSGELASTRRKGGQRLFDLAERCIPAAFLSDQASDNECLTKLLGHAGAALGVATTDDLADYLRIPTPVAARILPETGLTPVRVENWGTAWADPQALARPTRPHQKPVFLGPFDNLIWYRPRVQRLFGFTQIFEAYKPPACRKYGYYVCPLLADGRLTGRADFARRDTALTIQHASLEPDAGPEATSDFTEACRTLAAATGQTRIELADHAAEALRPQPSRRRQDPAP